MIGFYSKDKTLYKAGQYKIGRTPEYRSKVYVIMRGNPKFQK
jgi:hypothetical protein